MLNLRTGKNDLAPVALTRRDSIKGLAAILAAGCAPAIASAAARGAARMGGMRGAASAACDYYDGVEYLESSGTQYIDTGITDVSTDTLVLKIGEMTQSDTYNGIMGNGSSWNTSDALMVSAVSSSALWFFEAGRGNIDCGVFGSSYTYIITMCSAYCKINNITTGTVSSGSGGNTLYACNRNVYILKCNTSDGNLSHGGLKAKVYYFISNDRHLVPVLHEGEGKMLDLCHNKLYSNAGTGSFIVGPRTGVIQVPKQGFGANTPSI